MEAWEMLRLLVVRTTGFPVELLERLRFETTASVIQEILAIEESIAALRERLLAAYIPQLVRRAYADDDKALRSWLSRCRHMIQRNRPVPNLEALSSECDDLRCQLMRWNQVLDQHAATLTAGRRTWEEELLQQRRALAAIVAAPDVQEAIFLSNPEMYAAVRRYLADDFPTRRTSDVRKFERRLVGYLQRFCAKNETQSFFGPINYGHLTPDQPANLRLRMSPQALRRRETFPSQWMAETLATRISAEPELRPYLRPRRGTLCTLAGERQLLFPGAGRWVALEQGSARLFRLADGRRTVSELAALLGEEWQVTWQRAERLQHQGALTTWIIIPGDCSDPLAYLQHWLDDLPETLSARRRWGEILREFRQTIATFATSNLPGRVALLDELEARFTAVSGESARRGAGMMYADRALLFEECLGDLEQCSLGGALARTINRQLQPILHLAQAYGRLIALRDQRHAHEILRRLRSAQGEAIPFLAYLQALSQHSAAGVPSQPDALDMFMDKLHELVRTHSDGRRVYLRADELPIPSPSPESDVQAYCSLDLMVAADSLAALQEGAFQVILGECHPQPLVWVFPTDHFLDKDSTAIVGPFIDRLGRQREEVVAGQFVFARKNKIFPYPLPGEFIELRPNYPDCRATPAADVQVREVDHHISLWVGERALRLYTPLKRRDNEPDPLAPFAFPAVQPPSIDLGDHTPRIQIGEIVYQRECWSVPGGPLGDSQARDFDMFVAIWRWKARLGLPDEVFVRAPQEPKPIYIDFTNYFLVELLDHVARQSQHLRITEMLPATDQLWLQRQTGRHCCEFRVLAVAGKQGHSV